MGMELTTMNILKMEGPLLVAASAEETDREDMLDILRCRNSVMEALSSCGYDVESIDVTPEDFNNISELAGRIKNLRPSCIFNLFEGFGTSPVLESEFCKILEDMDIPFTGNPSATLARCLNKETAKVYLRSNGIDVPGGFTARSPLGKLPSGLGYPLFLKPCCEDGSVGIDDSSLVRNRSELASKLGEKLLNHPSGVIVEDFIPGREFNVAFLGNGSYEVQSVSVLDYGKYENTRPFLGYDSKWDSTSPEYEITFNELDPSEENLRERIIWIASEAGRALGCRGYFRVDLREKGGRFYVLDVNPNPDINMDSGFVRQSRIRGYSYAELLERIIDLAVEERADKNNYEIRHIRVYRRGRVDRSLYIS